MLDSPTSVVGTGIDIQRAVYLYTTHHGTCHMVWHGVLIRPLCPHAAWCVLLPPFLSLLRSAGPEDLPMSNASSLNGNCRQTGERDTCDENKNQKNAKVAFFSHLPAYALHYPTLSSAIFHTLVPFRAFKIHSTLRTVSSILLRPAGGVDINQVEKMCRKNKNLWDNPRCANVAVNHDCNFQAAVTHTAACCQPPPPPHQLLKSSDAACYKWATTHQRMFHGVWVGYI